jgi:hypothetical protein
MQVLDQSCAEGQLTIVVPWVVEYLAQMDSAAPLIPAFAAVCLRSG